MVTADPHHTTGNNDNLGYFLSCDWGTSSFRLRLVVSTGALKKPPSKHPGPHLKSLPKEREKSVSEHSKELVQSTRTRIVAGISNDQGIKKVYKQCSDSVEPQDKIKYYRSFLKQQISGLKRKCDQNLDGLPLVISGMASSSIGMKELPYGGLPFSLDHPDVKSELFEATDQFPHVIYLISGLQSSRDVMRGEETELIGLFAAADISNSLIILAGTHSKHVIVQNKAVSDFKTYMTGELFDLLSSKSIISNSVATPDNGPGTAFVKGVRCSINGNILHELFTIRARDILNQSDPVENYDHLSGLLIGAELKDIRQGQAGKIVLAGNNRLQKYYAAALNILGLNFTQIDSLAAENITPLGHLRLLNQLVL